MKTHLVVCKNPKALEHLYKPVFCCSLIAHASEKGKPVLQGDALIARDELLKAGFEWGKDFYLKKIDIEMERKDSE